MCGILWTILFVWVLFSPWLHLYQFAFSSGSCAFSLHSYFIILLNTFHKLPQIFNGKARIQRSKPKIKIVCVYVVPWKHKHEQSSLDEFFILTLSIGEQDPQSWWTG